jgi:hypothetical protein
MFIGVIATVALLLTAGPATAKSSGFVVHPGNGAPTITATSGEYFTISGGAGGNRDFQQIEVDCADGTGTVIYGTVINVTFDASGNATSQTIYAPASHCTAYEEKPMQIGRPHILATITFDVAP